jgi:signal transduction histidine kinase/DNA-binding response OmpR family regulator
MTKILVVDDCVDNRELFVTLLRYRGHQTVEAADGEEALARVKEEHPSLIISDILMPSMDGFEFVRRLRMDPQQRDTAVVFSSAHYLSREATELARAFGVDVILPKPIEPDAFLAAIEHVLAGHASAGGSTDPQSPSFNDAHRRLLTDQLATTVGALRASNERLQELVQVGLRLGATAEPDILLQDVSQAVRRLLGARLTVVLLIEGEQRAIRALAVTGAAHPGILPAASRIIPGTVCADIIDSGKVIRLNLTHSGGNKLGLPGDLPAIEDFLGAPLGTPERVRGVICVADRFGSSFTVEDESLVRAVGAQAGQALETMTLLRELNDRNRELKQLNEEKTRLLACAADNATKLDREHAALLAAQAELERVNAELENRVEQRTAELVAAQKMEVVGQLTAGVAHDFNNLLQAISGGVTILQRQLANDGARRWLDVIERSVGRGARLTQYMLAFARRQSLTPISTNICELLDRIEPLLEHSAGALVRSVINVGSSAWPAMIDPTQLELAILNLTINAHDAMPAGGTLSVDVDNATITAPGLGHHPADLPPGDYVVVKVRDTGAGMSAETLARACEPFFTTKPVGAGSGLGLSMVYGMVIQSGGGMHIISQIGYGTTVAIYLPRAVDDAREEANKATPSPVQATKDTNRVVLLVDDDELVRSGMAADLEALGYQVVEAESAGAALAVLQQRRVVDILVTDYAMHGMNGTTLVREAHRLAPDLPALIITGYADLDGDNAGIPILQKPFQSTELIMQMDALLHC